MQKAGRPYSPANQAWGSVTWDAPGSAEGSGTVLEESSGSEGSGVGTGVGVGPGVGLGVGVGEGVGVAGAVTCRVTDEAETPSTEALTVMFPAVEAT